VPELRRIAPQGVRDRRGDLQRLRLLPHRLARWYEVGRERFGFRFGLVGFRCVRFRCGLIGFRFRFRFRFRCGLIGFRFVRILLHQFVVVGLVRVGGLTVRHHPSCLERDRSCSKGSGSSSSAGM
jgi:hypothetical protein